jgi:hypothetical protein
MRVDDWTWVDGEDSWVPPAVDFTKPSVARIYDYSLGGKDNYPVDREIAEEFMRVVPDAPAAARANRAFLIDVVRAMSRAGIRQFLDLGTGIPTSPSVHETAWEIDPEARIAYVDNDPVVLAHNRALLWTDPRVAVLPHDLRRPAELMEDPGLQRVLDFTAPIGLLMIAVLHFVDLVSAPPVIDRYLHQLPRGSQVAISVLSSDGIPTDVLRAAETAYGREAATLVYRTRSETLELFHRLEMILPVTAVYRSSTVAVLGGVGRKN